MKDDTHYLPKIGEKATIVALCEIDHIFLHPNQLYIFEQVPGCATCAEYARMDKLMMEQHNIPAIADL